MDKQEAKAFLSEHVERLRAQSHGQLKELMGDSQHLEITGPSGTEYQLEFEAWWDDKRESNLRVIVSIDDGGLRAIVPVTESFIIAPDGSFVGETAEASETTEGRGRIGMVLSRLTSLFKRPEPAGPPELLRAFTTSDSPLTQDGVIVDGDGWRIESSEERTVRLFELPDPRVEQCILAYRAQVKTEKVQGRVYLEMWCRVPERGEFFSRGFQQAVKGTTDWSSHETPFLLKAGQRPDLIKLNIVSEGAGSAWIKDVELLRTPLK